MSVPEPGDRLARDLRAPAAAGIAGVVFSAVLLAVLVLMHTSIPAGPGSRVPQLVDSRGLREARFRAQLGLIRGCVGPNVWTHELAVSCRWGVWFTA